MGKTKTTTTESAPTAAQPDESYFEGQAAIAPEDVPPISAEQQTSSDDGVAPPTSDAEASEQGSPPPPDAAAPPSSSSEEPTKPALEQLLNARIVRARTADPTTMIIVSGESISGIPREIDTRTVRRRSRAHLYKLLSDERIVFEIVD